MPLKARPSHGQTAQSLTSQLVRQSCSPPASAEVTFAGGSFLQPSSRLSVMALRSDHGGGLPRFFPWIFLFGKVSKTGETTGICKEGCLQRMGINPLVCYFILTCVCSLGQTCFSTFSRQHGCSLGFRGKSQTSASAFFEVKGPEAFEETEAPQARLHVVWTRRINLCGPFNGEKSDLTFEFPCAFGRLVALKGDSPNRSRISHPGLA